MKKVFVKNYAEVEATYFPLGQQLMSGYNETKMESIPHLFEASSLPVEIKIKEMEEGTIEITLSKLDDVEIAESASNVSSKIAVDKEVILKIKKENLRKIPHDMVCYCLSGVLTSDFSLKSLLSPDQKGQFETDRTPDVLCYVVEQLIALEIGTDPKSNGKNYHENKVLKMSEIMNKVGLEDMSMAVIVVSFNTIYANFHIEDKSWLRAVAAHYQLGVRIFELLKSRNLIPSDSEEKSEMNLIRDFMRAIGVEYQEDNQFTIENRKLVPESIEVDWRRGNVNRFSMKPNLMKKFEESYTEAEVELLANKLYKKSVDVIREKKENPVLLQFLMDKREYESKINNFRLLSNKPLQTSIIDSDCLEPSYENADMMLARSRIAFNKKTLELEQYGVKEDITSVTLKIMMNSGEFMVNEMFLNEPQISGSVRELKFPGYTSELIGKSSFQLVKAKLNETELAILSLEGLNAKKRRENPDILAKKLESQKYLRFDSDTSREDELFENLKRPVFGGSRELLNGEIAELIHQAEAMSVEPLTFISEFEQTIGMTDLGRGLSLWDTIMHELMNGLKSQTKEKEFVLKRVKRREVWILSHTSSISGHIYYSIFFLKKRGCDMRFWPGTKTLAYEDETCGLTTWSSMSRDKASSCMNLFEKYVGLLSTWCQLFKFREEDLIYEIQRNFKSEEFLNENERGEIISYKRNYNTNNEFLSTRIDQIMSMTAGSFMLLMAAKQEVTDMSSLLRYSYFNVVSMSVIEYNPGILFSKFPIGLRSKVGLWLYKRITKIWEKMVVVRPRPIYQPDLESDLDLKMSKDYEWQNLESVFDVKLTTVETAVNSGYLGHTKATGGTSMGHSNLQILDKMLKKDLQLYPELCRGTRLGFSKNWRPLATEPARLNMLGNDALSTNIDWWDYKDFEWDHKLVSTMGDMFKEIITKRVGGNFDSFLFQNMLKTSLRDTPEVMSTLQASANIDMDSLIYKKGKSKSKNRRVMTGILELLLSDKMSHLSIFTKLGELMEELEESSYSNLIAIFKKLQKTGVREIFILNILMRVMMRFIENLSYGLNEQCDVEMLSKGKDKYAYTLANSTKVKTAILEENKDGHEHVSVTGSNAADYSSWSPLKMMNKFYNFFSHVLPEDFKNFLVRAVDITTAKRVKIPDVVLRSFDDKEKSDVPSMSSEVLNILKALFKGEIVLPELMQKGETTIRIASGFMQGVWHQASSSMHTAAMYFLKKCILIKFQELKRKKVIPSWWRIELTMQVSSDDSGLMVNIICRKGDDMTLARNIVTNLCYMQPLMARGWGTKFSYEKSTLAILSGSYEFNSYFLIGNTFVTPLIKFVSPALNVIMSQNFPELMNYFSSMRKNLCENGGTVAMAAIFQLLQLRVFYRTIGALINPFWKQFKRRLLEKPHPSLGFFLLETPFMPIMGLNAALTQSMEKSEPLRRICKSMLSKSRGIISGGGINISVSFRIGDSKNFREFLDKELHYEKDWRKLIDENPDLLFRLPQNREETKALIFSKGSMGAERFSFENITKIFTRAVFLLDKPCMTTISQDIENKRSVDFDAWITSKGYDKDLIMDSNVKSIYESYLYENPNAKVIFKESLISVVDNTELGEELDDTDKYILDPLRDLHLEVFYNLRLNKDDFSLTPIQERRRIMVEFSTISKQFDTLVPILPCLAHHWWRRPTKNIPLESLEISLQKYLKHLPFIKSTVSETLENSYFQDVVEMFNFFTVLDTRSRGVMMLAPIKQGTVMQILENMLKFSFVRGHRLGKKFNKMEFERDNNAKELIIQSNLILSSNLNMESKLIELVKHHQDDSLPEEVENAKYELTKSPVSLRPLRLFLDTVRRLNNLNNVVANFNRVYKSPIEKIEFQEKLKASRAVLNSRFFELQPYAFTNRLGAWIKRQEPRGGSWFGAGTWLGRFGFNIVEIKVFDDRILSINTNANERSLSDSFKSNFRAWMNYFKFKTTNSREEGVRLTINGDVAAGLEAGVLIQKSDKIGDFTDEMLEPFIDFYGKFGFKSRIFRNNLKRYPKLGQDNDLIPVCFFTPENVILSTKLPAEEAQFNTLADYWVRGLTCDTNKLLTTVKDNVQKMQILMRRFMSKKILIYSVNNEDDLRTLPGVSSLTDQEFEDLKRFHWLRTTLLAKLELQIGFTRQRVAMQPVVEVENDVHIIQDRFEDQDDNLYDLDDEDDDDNLYEIDDESDLDENEEVMNLAQRMLDGNESEVSDNEYSDSEYEPMNQQDPIFYGEIPYKTRVTMAHPFWDGVIRTCSKIYTESFYTENFFAHNVSDDTWFYYHWLIFANDDRTRVQHFDILK